MKEYVEKCHSKSIMEQRNFYFCKKNFVSEKIWLSNLNDLSSKNLGNKVLSSTPCLLPPFFLFFSLRPPKLLIFSSILLGCFDGNNENSSPCVATVKCCILLQYTDGR